jgi:hypothetical protein
LHWIRIWMSWVERSETARNERVETVDELESGERRGREETRVSTSEHAMESHEGANASALDVERGISRLASSARSQTNLWIQQPKETAHANTLPEQTDEILEVEPSFL